MFMKQVLLKTSNDSAFWRTMLPLTVFTAITKKINKKIWQQGALSYRSPQMDMKCLKLCGYHIHMNLKETSNKKFAMEKFHLQNNMKD
jgi:hypothetical protein